MKLGGRLGVAVWLGCLVGLAGCATSPGETPVAAGAAAGDSGGRASQLVEMGDRAAAAGDSRTAIGYYQQAAGPGASDMTALLRMGDALLKERRWQDAADVFQRALKQRPGDPDAHRGYARALLGLDQAGPASVHLQEALKARPDDARALNMLGVAYDMMGQGGDALATYRRGLAAAPDDPDLVNNLGLSHALAGDFDAAVAQLEPLANGPASTARTRQNLALVYGLKGDMLAAERIGRLDLDAASVRGNIAFASALRGGGDPAASASALLTELATEKPAARPRKPPTDAMPTELDTGGMSSAGRPPRALTAGPSGPATPVPAGQQIAGEPGADQLDMPLPITPAALALTDVDMISGLAPTAGWLVDLGTFEDRPGAAAAWRRLRGAHPDLLGGMTRLAGVEDGRQPLLVGPVASEGEADRICGSLAAQGVTCTKLQV